MPLTQPFTIASCAQVDKHIQQLQAEVLLITVCSDMLINQCDALLSKLSLEDQVDTPTATNK